MAWVVELPDVKNIYGKDFKAKGSVCSSKEGRLVSVAGREGRQRAIIQGKDGRTGWERGGGRVCGIC